MQAPSDDLFYTVTGDTIYGTYIPSDTSSSGGSSGGSAPGTGPVVAETSGGITINLLFDAATMAAPASFRAGIAQAAAILASTISDKITVNLNIDYSGTGGGAAAGPDSGLFENYSTIRSDLVNGATPGDGTFNALPTGSSIQGQSYVAVWNAQLKLWGFLGANDTTTDDGSATFATDINPNLLVGVALHELTHAMGRVVLWTAAGRVRPVSLHQCRHALVCRRQYRAGRLFLDRRRPYQVGRFRSDLRSQRLPQQRRAGTERSLQRILRRQHHSGPDRRRQADPRRTRLSHDGAGQDRHRAGRIDQPGRSRRNNFFLNPVGGGNGPQLEHQGTPVTAGASGTWTPVGAEQVSGGGYEVAWRLPGTDEFALDRRQQRQLRLHYSGIDRREQAQRWKWPRLFCTRT